MNREDGLSSDKITGAGACFEGSSGGQSSPGFPAAWPLQTGPRQSTSTQTQAGALLALPKHLKMGKTWPARCLNVVNVLQLGHVTPCLMQGIQTISRGGHFREVPMPPWCLATGSYAARPCTPHRVGELCTPREPGPEQLGTALELS